MQKEQNLSNMRAFMIEKVKKQAELSWAKLRRSLEKDVPDSRDDEYFIFLLGISSWLPRKRCTKFQLSNVSLGYFSGWVDG